MHRFTLALRFFLIALCLVALGAHFFRQAAFSLVLPCLFGLVLMWIPRRWAIFPVQFLLTFGALVWVATLNVLRLQRIEEGRPWMRMAIILGVVGALSLLAAVLPFFGRMGDYYRRGAKRKVTDPE